MCEDLHGKSMTFKRRPKFRPSVHQCWIPPSSIFKNRPCMENRAPINYDRKRRLSAISTDPDKGSTHLKSVSHRQQQIPPSDCRDLSKAGARRFWIVRKQTARPILKTRQHTPLRSDWTGSPCIKPPKIDSIRTGKERHSESMPWIGLVVEGYNSQRQYDTARNRN